MPAAADLARLSLPPARRTIMLGLIFGSLASVTNCGARLGQPGVSTQKTVPPTADQGAREQAQKILAELLDQATGLASSHPARTRLMAAHTAHISALGADFRSPSQAASPGERPATAPNVLATAERTAAKTLGTSMLVASAATAQLLASIRACLLAEANQLAVKDPA